MNDKAKKRLPLGRFSLRSFIVLVVVAAIWFAWLSNRAQQQRKAVLWIESVGGTALYDYQVDEEGNRNGNSRSNWPGLLVNALGQDYFSSVIYVDLNETPVESLEQTRSLRKLRTLRIAKTKITHVGTVSQFQNLRYLDVSNTSVSDLSAVSALRNLTRIEASKTRVADLAPLRECSKLEVISLSNTQVQDLAPLEGMTGLRQLSLDQTAIESLSPLRRLENLEFLLIWNTGVSKSEADTFRVANPTCRVVHSFKLHRKK